MKTAKRIENPEPGHPHRNAINCKCPPCKLDRQKGCPHPNKCAQKALNVINGIAPKLNPKHEYPPDNLSFTHRRKQQNIVAHRENGEITFDPSVTCKTSLAECFRIFVDDKTFIEEPADRLTFVGNGLNLPKEHQTIYTDGACFNNGKENARCGAGIWIAHNHPRNRSIRIPGPQQTNQVGELVAIAEAVRQTENFAPLTIKSDSKYSINGLTKHLQEWEDRGWIGIRNSIFFRVAATLLRMRTATTKFKWVKGHNGEPGNEQSDEKAKEGAEKDEPDELDLTIKPSFNLQGAKIATITQSIAYQGIRERVPPHDRPRANINLGRAQAALKEFTNETETYSSLWESCFHKDLQKKIQQFLFRSIHQVYRLGDQWDHIPGYEALGKCTSCGHTNEDMEHILTDQECTNEVAKTIWRLARELWPYGDEAWPEINLGIILACGKLTVKKSQIYAGHGNGESQNETTNKNDIHQGASRLLRILISESAHLIWVLRCERTIGKKSHTRLQIITRWQKQINNRLTMDRIVAIKLRRTEKLRKQTAATWTDVLHNPPDNWHKQLEVLVGIKPPRTPN
ncbi:RnaseH-domain-containing protein [Dentipellis sp. KUC8613]|nr:RnaseH-domain-containing protein [Dentipellis sp. KUC8613]